MSEAGGVEKHETVPSMSGEAVAPKEKNTTLAAIAYVLFFVPLLGNERHDSFIKFHVRQGIGLLLAALVLQGIISILSSWGVGPRSFLVWPVRIFLVFELAQGIVHASRGEKEELPLIGMYVSRLFG